MTTSAVRSQNYDLEYYTSVARGKVPGARPFGSYGEKTTVGVDAGVLWPDGPYTFPPAAGAALTVVSTSAQDSAAGTGMKTLDIHYLDANLEEHVVAVALNGLTPVATGITDARFIQCMHRLTGVAAAGHITAYNGANVYSQIAAGELRCSSSVRMVPKGKRLLVTSMYGGAVSGTATASVILRFATPTFDGHDYIADGLFIPMFSAGFQDSSSGITIPVPIPFTEGQVAGLTFETDKAATITGSWFGLLENL